MALAIAFDPCSICDKSEMCSMCELKLRRDGSIKSIQEWISVKDRLPEGDSYILVTADGVVQYAYWHNDRFYSFTAIGIVMIYRVTHWMPLPQPPKGE